eukprot:1157256-Pelagomonas_calceolata.AAC.2
MVTLHRYVQNNAAHTFFYACACSLHLVANQRCNSAGATQQRSGSATFLSNLPTTSRCVQKDTREQRQHHHPKVRVCSEHGGPIPSGLAERSGPVHEAQGPGLYILVCSRTRAPPPTKSACLQQIEHGGPIYLGKQWADLTVQEALQRQAWYTARALPVFMLCAGVGAVQQFGESREKVLIQSYLLSSNEEEKKDGGALNPPNPPQSKSAITPVRSTGRNAGKQCTLVTA